MFVSPFPQRRQRYSSVVRHANDRALRGWLYDRVFFGMLPSHHIVNSEATRKTLLESASWIDPGTSRSSIMKSILSIRDRESVELGVPDGAFTFGFVARLEVRKG